MILLRDPDFLMPSDIIPYIIHCCHQDDLLWGGDYLISLASLLSGQVLVEADS